MPLPHFLLLVAVVILAAGATLVLALTMGVPLEALALGAREDQVVLQDIVESGNTSAGSVPLALSKYWHRGELPRGGRALLLGFGGGFTYAGQVVTLPA